MLLLSLLLL